MAPPADEQGRELGARPKSSAVTSRPPTPVVEEKTDRLERYVMAMMEAQRRQQERMDVEAQRQDQRWKAMEHQFQQLQTWVRGEQEAMQTVRQPLTDQQEVDPLYSRPSSALDPLLGMPPLDIPTPQPRPGQVPAPREQSSLDSSRIGQTTPLALQQGWKPPKMSPYNEDEDIEHYLTTFERLAVASQWPREAWALYLVPLLKGKARAAYVAMNVEDSQDYDRVKQAILRKYEISEETYRQRFRSDTILEGETAKELHARLKDLAEKWLDPGRRTKEDICDLIVLEQFLSMLSHELQVWVRERTPRTAAEAADLVETFVAARQSRSSYQMGPQSSGRRPHQTAQHEPARTSAAWSH
ncbi:hypothetical protein ACEWY4_025613 [Coilia grayii]|uniref:SCAN box domain-containing protein n=1 Tax=Coilia grayii TaxID=363190 RepID=A0ABD1IWH2_9TELE